MLNEDYNIEIRKHHFHKCATKSYKQLHISYVDKSWARQKKAEHFRTQITTPAVACATVNAQRKKLYIQTAITQKRDVKWCDSDRHDLCDITFVSLRLGQTGVRRQHTFPAIHTTTMANTSWPLTRDVESLFLWNSNTDSGVRKFRALDSDSDSGPKIPGLRLQLGDQNQALTPTLGLIVWHADCVLKDDLKEILNSNKRCTRTVYTGRNRVVLGSVYNQGVVRARSRSLAQKGDSDSDPGTKTAFLRMYGSGERCL